MRLKNQTRICQRISKPAIEDRRTTSTASSTLVTTSSMTRFQVRSCNELCLLCFFALSSHRR